MSKLYGTLQGCNNGEATRRGHKSIHSTVKNWEWALDVEMHDNGGGDKDTISVELRSIHTGKRIVIVEGPISVVASSDTLAPLMVEAMRQRA